MIPMIREMHVTFLLLIVLAVIENEKTVIANIRQKEFKNNFLIRKQKYSTFFETFRSKLSKNIFTIILIRVHIPTTLASIARYKLEVDEA